MSETPSRWVRSLTRALPSLLTACKMSDWRCLASIAPTPPCHRTPPGPVRVGLVASSVLTETPPDACLVPGIDVGSGSISVIQLPASLTWPARRPARPPYPPLPEARPGRRTPSPRRPPPADEPRLPDARPGAPYPVSPDAPIGRRGGRPRPRRWAGSWQRIDGVSRLLPYSDLLALTSSSRRGEGVSDRGSWKRLRTLPTGHVDARVEPDIEMGAVLIGPAWCLDR